MKYPAKLIDDKLELVFNAKETVQLTRLQAIALRMTLNDFINGEMEEEEEE
jgi:hypothetical protein